MHTSHRGVVGQNWIQLLKGPVRELVHSPHIQVHVFIDKKHKALFQTLNDIRLNMVKV